MVVVSLGSNLGERLNTIYEAVEQLKAQSLRNVKVSCVLETEALLPRSAPQHWNLPYLNLVLVGQTHLSPHELLKKFKHIERSLGRPKEYERWAPRAIDLDILAWDDLVIATEDLTLPHPELLQRPFLIALMAHICPHWRYPVASHADYGKSIGEIAHRYPNQSRCFTRSMVLEPRLVGIVNVTPDSFSDGGLFEETEKAVKRAFELFEQGASVIEFGAQSTRPGAKKLTAREESVRLEPVLTLFSQRMSELKIKPQISLDTHSSEVFASALSSCPLNWINDVTGGSDPKLLRKAVEFNCKLVCMHSLGVPPESQCTLPFNSFPIETIMSWAKQKIQALKNEGLALENIILDPGIGFGKSAYQSIALLQHAPQLKELGCEILVGHSRKSFIKSFSNADAAARDLETIVLSSHLGKAGIDYLRVHNVADHQRGLVAAHMLKT